MALYQSEYKVNVSFEDLDPMNIVWHGNYMRYMEQARCDLLSKLGYTYLDMKKEGYGYPVAKMKVKYIKPATLEDILTIITEVETIEPTLNIKYTMYKDGDKIFEAKTMQIAINIETGESLYNPPNGLVNAVKKEKE